MYLEDDDVAAVTDGHLTIHRVKRSLQDNVNREIITLKMEIQQIMKGNYSYFMQKVSRRTCAPLVLNTYRFENATFHRKPKKKFPAS